MIILPPDTGVNEWTQHPPVVREHTANGEK